MRGLEVITAADSPEEVVAAIRRKGLRATSVFRVPLDPSVDLGGFPG